jgi:hypothetical protein
MLDTYFNNACNSQSCPLCPSFSLQAKWTVFFLVIAILALFYFWWSERLNRRTPSLPERPATENDLFSRRRTVTEDFDAVQFDINRRLHNNNLNKFR